MSKRCAVNGGRLQLLDRPGCLSNGRDRVSLLKTFKDGFYPGIHLLSDGTLVATTYANDWKEDIGTSIVSVRFTMSEVEAMAKK